MSAQPLDVLLSIAATPATCSLLINMAVSISNASCRASRLQSHTDQRLRASMTNIVHHPTPAAITMKHRIHDAVPHPFVSLVCPGRPRIPERVTTNSRPSLLPMSAQSR